ncbi:DUF4145 domain-containing protein [Bradyrhizobium sp. 76]|uniref:DUF4145 domain-containing protein n=1 Tax=Bradyrhizobium sp. 76 TaxID=2782680 RepID=UPI001FFB67BA|nr:DUF4145 domain-containing protein [Bradyrhizobium sp. 76]MCK1404905.1 DUF4145 domain-containing protein [Bradyrhizobium sp. 76]
MAVDRTLWHASFLPTEIPHFPCPRCSKPFLGIVKDTLHIEETRSSKNNKKSPEWEPEWSDEKFVCLLSCSKCGDIVAVSGRISVEPNYDDDGDWQFAGFLEPMSMYPAPHIITLPQKLPSEVRSEMELAFQLFWSDFGACATKIRTSVERLMDHFKVARFRRAKDPKKPAAPGKLKPLDLSSRIDKFISTTGAIVHKEHLHALRIAGNLGTHNNTLTRTEML